MLYWRTARAHLYTCSATRSHTNTHTRTTLDTANRRNRLNRQRQKIVIVTETKWNALPVRNESATVFFVCVYVLNVCVCVWLVLYYVNVVSMCGLIDKLCTCNMFGQHTVLRLFR